jgi:hypothetical protein
MNVRTVGLIRKGATLTMVIFFATFAISQCWVRVQNPIYLGAWVNPSGVPGGSGPAVVAAFETSIGRKLALAMHYYGWSDTFPGSAEADDLVNGRIPVISWNCGVPNAQVASGTSDSVIGKRADAIKAYGSTVFIRYMWEMNLASNANYRSQCYDPATDNANGQFSPTEYIAAWQHIRQVFAAHGVTNVIWLWNPSGNVANGPNAPLYYPGDSQVDWVGIDAYPTQGQTFAATFQSTYTLLAPLNKPILIAETGGGPATSPDAQVSYLQSVVPTLKAQFPSVKGFMYFDANGTNYDWRLTTTGMAAFSTMAVDPYMGRMPVATH